MGKRRVRVWNFPPRGTRSQRTCEKENCRPACLTACLHPSFAPHRFNNFSNDSLRRGLRYVDQLADWIFGAFYLALLRSLERSL